MTPTQLRADRQRRNLDYPSLNGRIQIRCTHLQEISYREAADKWAMEHGLTRTQAFSSWIRAMLDKAVQREDAAE